VRYEDVLEAVATMPAAIRPPVLALNPSSLQEVLDDIARVGEAIGASEHAAVVLDSMCGRIDEAHACAMELLAGRPRRVACLEWIAPPMLAGNWMPELVELAGGQCDLTTFGEHSAYADWDAIRRFDPEVIVIMPCGFDLPRAIVEAQSLPAMSGWKDLAAVRAGRVFAVDGNAYFNRSGPRLVDSLELLMRLVNCEAYKMVGGHDPMWRQLATVGEALVPVDPVE
jgi:iron complex transport system substrate-binding protein